MKVMTITMILSLKKLNISYLNVSYLDEIKPFLKDIINNLKILRHGKFS